MKLIAKISMLLAATCFMVASCDPAEKPEGPGIVVPPTPEPGPEPTPEPGPIKPAPGSITFQEIIEKGAGTYEVKSAVVVASAAFNFVVTDGTGYMLLYDLYESAEVGNVLSLSGEVTEFNGILEWKTPKIEIVSTDFKFSHPEPQQITADFILNQSKNPEIVYGVATGEKKGKNIYVDYQLLYTYSNESIPDGQVTVYGYTIGYSAKFDNVTFVVTGFKTEEKPDPTPEPEPNPDPNPTPGPDPTPGTSLYPWAELPVMYDADRNGVHDNDANLYYATHFTDLKSPTGGAARNYTVCFSGEHHCPVWVAAPRHQMYQVKGVKRTDAYKRDPKIPADIQYYSKSTGSGCNKGHMLGSAERIASRTTNEQVFYYSNIAPQLSSGFNTGGGGWNILEEFVDGQVCSDTLYVVIGCYFDKFTDGYGESASPKTITFGGRNDVDMPTMFYYALLRTKKGNSGKSVRNCSASEIQCAAFVRTHTNSLKGQRVSSKEMMSISDLEKITGIRYFENVPNAPKTSFKASEWGL